MAWMIVSDTSCDIRELSPLSPGVQFSLVPFKIRIGEREYVDLPTLNVPQMIQAMTDYNGASTTACPSPEEWAEKFLQADQVIAMTISSNLSGSYNFLADSMKLSNINVSMTTNVLEKVSISAGMTLDPYAVNNEGRRYNRYNVTAVPGFRLVRLTNANISLGFSLSGEGKGKGNDGSSVTGGGGGGGVKMTGESPAYTRVYYHPVTGEYIPGGWIYYLNPEVPWSVSFNYSYNFSRSYQSSNGQLIVRNNHTQTLNINGQVRITKALNLNLTTGFDITQLRLTTTQVSATYDLHCFQISFSWVPVGQWKQWSFRINAKAAALADLLSYRKGTSQWDN